MGLHTVETDQMKLESMKFINGDIAISNAKIVSKKGTHKKLRRDNLALRHKKESPLIVFYNLQKECYTLLLLLLVVDSQINLNHKILSIILS